NRNTAANPLPWRSASAFVTISALGIDQPFQLPGPAGNVNHGFGGGQRNQINTLRLWRGSIILVMVVIMLMVVMTMPVMACCGRRRWQHLALHRQQQLCQPAERIGGQLLQLAHFSGDQWHLLQQLLQTAEWLAV